MCNFSVHFLLKFYKLYFFLSLNRWYKYITEANETFTKHEGRHSRASAESDNMEIINEESISRDHMQTIDENGSTNSSQDSNDDNISMKSAEDEPQQPTKSTETPQPEEQQGIVFIITIILKLNLYYVKIIYSIEN